MMGGNGFGGAGRGIIGDCIPRLDMSIFLFVRYYH